MRINRRKIHFPLSVFHLGPLFVLTGKF